MERWKQSTANKYYITLIYAIFVRKFSPSLLRETRTWDIGESLNPRIGELIIASLTLHTPIIAKMRKNRKFILIKHRIFGLPAVRRRVRNFVYIYIYITKSDFYPSASIINHYNFLHSYFASSNQHLWFILYIVAWSLTLHTKTLHHRSNRRRRKGDRRVLPQKLRYSLCNSAGVVHGTSI